MRSVHLHAVGVVPVELSAGDGQSAAHPLEDLSDLLVHLLNLVLVCSFSAEDCSDDIVCVCLCESDSFKALL